MPYTSQALGGTGSRSRRSTRNGGTRPSPANGGRAKPASATRPVATPGSSVRAGDYKLIEFFEDGHAELYNLRDDIGEDRDLSEELPEVTRRLRTLLAQWRESIEARIPQPDADFTPWPEMPMAIASPMTWTFISSGKTSLRIRPTAI